MKKAGVVSFKVSRSFLEAMKGVPNRSEFIRAAVLTALDSACPLCKGTGILTPNQKRHWQTFAHDHSLQECQDCHELRLICEGGRGADTEHGPVRSVDPAGPTRRGRPGGATGT